MEKVKLQTSLLKQCKDETQRIEVRQGYLASYEYRQALIETLKGKREAARKTSLTKDSYESSNWAYKQADNVGYQRAIEEILKYL